jgi:2'-5' RNA ligase
MELQTGVGITAPHEVQALAVPILKRYSPDLLVVFPAHITLLYPFAQPARLEEACVALRALCATLVPFEITLDGYDHFPRVTFMKPVNPDPIRHLFRQIHALFPECVPYDGEFGTDIHPHLTVCMFDSEAEQQQATLPDYEPITFLAHKLDVLSGPSSLDLPWLTYAVIPFGG